MFRSILYNNPIKRTLKSRTAMATIKNSKMGYGIEITEITPKDGSPQYLKFKCGLTTKKYTNYSEASISHHQQIMNVAKRFIEEELYEHSRQLNYTLVSLTGNRWVAVAIDTV